MGDRENPFRATARLARTPLRPSQKLNAGLLDEENEGKSEASRPPWDTSSGGAKVFAVSQPRSSPVEQQRSSLRACRSVGNEDATAVASRKASGAAEQSVPSFGRGSKIPRTPVAPRRAPEQPQTPDADSERPTTQQQPVGAEAAERTSVEHIIPKEVQAAEEVEQLFVKAPPSTPPALPANAVNQEQYDVHARIAALELEARTAFTCVSELHGLFVL